MAGSREKAWGKKKQFREGQAVQVLDDLVFEYVRTIDKLKPKVCLLENVRGIIQGNAKVYSKEIVRQMTAAGYRVQVFLLKSLKKLDLMLDLVYGIASKKATEKQYEIGFRVGVNKTLRRVHGDSKSLDPDEKTRIGVRVNKLLEVALVAAENAARGKFYDPNPSDMHMTAIDFLYLKNLPVLPDDVDDLFAA